MRKNIYIYIYIYVYRFLLLYGDLELTLSEVKAGNTEEDGDSYEKFHPKNTIIEEWAERPE